MSHPTKLVGIAKQVGLGGGELAFLPFPSAATVVVDATADVIPPATFTAGMLGGMLLRDPAGSARTDTTATASEILAAVGNAQTGQSFLFIVRNTADANEVITVAGGTGVTISGTATIAQNATKIFVAVVTSSTTITVYSVGSLTH
jgi:hypothetical protein